MTRSKCVCCPLRSSTCSRAQDEHGPIGFHRVVPLYVPEGSLRGLGPDIRPTNSQPRPGRQIEKPQGAYVCPLFFLPTRKSPRTVWSAVAHRKSKSRWRASSPASRFRQTSSPRYLTRMLPSHGSPQSLISSGGSRRSSCAGGCAPHEIWAKLQRACGLWYALVLW
jgi:hypothetical protein